MVSVAAESNFLPLVPGSTSILGAPTAVAHLRGRCGTRPGLNGAGGSFGSHSRGAQDWRTGSRKRRGSVDETSQLLRNDAPHFPSRCRNSHVGTLRTSERNGQEKWPPEGRGSGSRLALSLAASGTLFCGTCLILFALVCAASFSENLQQKLAILLDFFAKVISDLQSFCKVLIVLHSVLLGFKTQQLLAEFRFTCPF